MIIPITATDNNAGNSTPQNLVIRVNGTNDLPIVSHISSKMVDEGSKPITGQITSTDVDHGDTATFSTNFSHTGFILNTDGSYTLDPTDPSFDHLAQGDHQTLIIPIITTDNNKGNSVSQNLIIRIDGTNDGAIISGVNTGNVTEESQLKTSGKLTVTDVDAGEAHFSNTDISGALGTLHLTDTGAWTYDLDNKNPKVQTLAQGQSTTDTVTVQSVDGTKHQITITVNGSNDKAIITGVDTGNVTEDVNPYSNVSASAHMIHTRGQLTITDTDSGEDHFDFKTFIHVATNPEWSPYHSQLGGRVSMTKNGEWEYEIDTTKPQIQALGAGETLKDSAVIESTDGTKHTIEFTIHGTNDVPTCSSEVVLSTGTEDTDIILTQAQLLANTSDIDNNDLNQLHVDSVTADHGTVTTNTDGSFTFHPAQDYNGQVHFSYDVKDAHGGITHTGAVTTLAAVNDNPDVTPITDSLTEDTDRQHQINLLGSATDVDGDSLSISQVQITFEGKTGPLPKGVSFASDGYTLIIDSHNPTFQHLSAGQKADILVHYMVDDNHGGQSPAVATVTMVGSDDKAQLLSSTIDMTESQALHTYYQMGSKVGGTLNLVDPDTSDHTQFAFSSDNGAQGYGGLTVWPDGRYEYDLDMARNHHANSKVASLKAGETLTDQYQIRTSDGQTKVVTVTIHGENDNARIEVSMPQLPASQDVTEEHFVPASPSHLYAGGILRVIDADHGDAQLQAENITTAHHGEFTIRARGGWSYKIDNAIDEVQHLGAGESFTESHTVHSKDGTASQILTVTVHGTNDAPVVSAEVQLAPGIEDTDIHLTKSDLLINATDIDHNDIGQLDVANLVADHGTIVTHKDGTFTFHPQHDYNGQVHLSYDVIDAHAGVTHTGATTTLSAVKDQAIVSGDITGNAFEDHNIYSQNQIEVTGHLLVTDPDVGQQGFQYTRSTSVSDPFGGSLHISASGTWTYDVDNAKLQHLGANQEVLVTHRVYTTDGTAQDIIIKVTGTNDAPVVSSEVVLQTGTEDTDIIFTQAQLLANTTDIDNNDLNQLHIDSVNTNHGTVSKNTDGSFTFHPDQDYNGQVHFTYDVKDAHSGVTHTGATTTLSAVQDNAVITGQDSGNVKEDVDVGPVVAGNANMIETHGQMHVSDPDAGENHFHVKNYGFIHDAGHPELHPIVSTLGGYLSIGSDGTWFYRIDTRKSVIQNLGEGESTTDTVTVTSIDGTSHIVTVTIHGTNDAPYCSSEVQLSSGTEDKDIHLTKSDLLINATDIDYNDIGQLSVANLTADHGTITVNKDGSFTLHPDKDYNGQVHFSYDVKDLHGGVTHTGATTSLAAVNDGAKVTEFNTENIVEDAPHSSVFAHEKYQIASGKLNVADPDAGEDHFQYSQFGETAISDPFQGHLRISSAGSWNYEVKNSALQYLAAGQTETVVYRVNTADGTPYDLHIKVLGTNDTPTATVVTLPHGTEDVSYQMQASQFGFADVDSGDTLHSVAITSAPDASTQGSFYLDGKTVTAGQTIAAGDISKMQFVPVKDFNGDIDFKYTVNDGHADSVEASNTIHIEPVADLALISGDTSGQATEDSHIVNSAFLQASGQLNITDADTLENSFQAENLHLQSDGSASMGGLAMQKDGSWSYVVDNARTEIQSLGANQQLTEKFTVHSADGTEQELMVTIHGTNDAPSLSFNTTSNTSGQLLGSDIDKGDAQQLQYDAIQPHGQFGRISVDSISGAYNYQPSSTIAGMSYNPQSHTYTGHEVFEVRVSDGHGGQTREFLTFTVTATVTAPAITGGQPTVSTAINSSPLLTTQAPTSITNTPPANSVNIDLIASSDSGASNTDNLTSDNTPTITGTTDVPFSQVTIYDGNTPVGHTLSDANGDYSANLASLADGTHNLSAKALAPSSVLPVVSPLLDIKVDTSTAVATVDLKSTADSGISDHDNLTNAHTPVITGAAEANSTITITDEHGAIVATGNADANGTYQLTTSNLTEGAHSLSVAATDAAGNQSHASLAIEVDYSAPTIAKVNLKTEAVHQPTFSGSVSLDTAQVDIVVKQGSQIIETLHATLDGKGGYSVDASNLPDGFYVAYIQATDNAGNQTPSGTAGIFDRFSVDTHASAPSISFETAGSDHIYNAQEVAAGAAGTITAIVHLPADMGSVDSITINGNSHQITKAEFIAGQVEIEVAPGSTVTASVTDKLGNVSSSTNETAPTADLTAATLTVSLTHDTGLGSDLITSDGSLTITGQEQGASVEYSTDNGQTWSQSFTPQQGSNSVNVRQTDVAGNVSPQTLLTFTLDNQVAAPSISLQHDTSAHAGQHADLITKDGQLNIAAEAGAKLEYSVDGGHSWTTQFSPIEGQNNLQVRQTDIAGNTSAATSFSYTLDTTPVTVAVDPISKDNALNTVENNQSLEITGTTSNIAAGDQVYVKFDDNSVYLATVKADGTWRLTLNASEHQSHMATDRNYPIKVGAVDVAGNVTPEITTHLLVDTQNPIPHISVNPVTADNIINLAESGRNIEISGQVSGDFKAGDVISLSINGAAISSLTGSVDAQGHYSIAVPAQTLMRANIHSIYASGQQQIHSIEATVITTDSAGNLGSATTGTQAFTIDTQADTSIQLDPITSDNVINAQESSADISVTGRVSGDAHQGDIVNLVVGQHSYSATVDHSGHFSVNIAGAELASNASITASVTTTDTAGNPASASQVMHYATDTKVDMPTITFENPGSDNAYSKAEIAQGHAGTITATIHAAADAQIGEHLNINGVDHVLDANSLAHGIALEVAPSSIVKAIMTDEHGNVNSALNMAANAKPEPIVVTAPPGSHHIGASLGVPTLLPTQTPVPVAEQGWKILVNGHYQTSYSSQWGTLTINPKTGQLNYQEHADTHTGPHGSATTVGVHEDRFEVAMQGSHHDDVVMHVQVNILSHGPGHSGKLTLGSEVLDMTVTPTYNHPAPPPPLPAADAHDEPQSDFITDVSVDLDAIVVADDSDFNAAAHTEYEEPSTASAAEQAEADPAATSQPVSATPVVVSAAVTSDPIDHYLQMVGMSHQDLAPKTDNPSMNELPEMQVLTSGEPDADMFDTNQVDAFDNPLLDDDKHDAPHKDLTTLDDVIEHQGVDQANDDDLLHQALNDMHNQL
ncbi:VCBS domain-containing protein [Shewanella sp. GutDb-MelDb]|uniref:VCBS domain-containing protein n=1 Tax=Shewanella sp. GutDb-MelDb TaxID=2058316 RepID=UPI001C60E94E|nr:VCBS domain-containing protein [Shewanella sp. GutDb-MelDb]